MSAVTTAFLAISRPSRRDTHDIKGSRWGGSIEVIEFSTHLLFVKVRVVAHDVPDHSLQMPAIIGCSPLLFGGVFGVRFGKQHAKGGKLTMRRRSSRAEMKLVKYPPRLSH